MRCVWLETSTLAYPAIQFYRRRGFELCGLDTSLYDSADPSAGETALYFARSLSGADEPDCGRRRDDAKAEVKPNSQR
jgi:ribosomal protein S18 acetylase RimI-like enzyme